MRGLKSILAILFYISQKIITALKPNKNSVRNETKKIRNNKNIIEHYQMLDDLQANIGQEVVIQSKNLSHLYQNQIKNTNNEFRGKLLEVDDDWLKLELYSSARNPDRSPDYLYFKTKVIVAFALIEKNE